MATVVKRKKNVSAPKRIPQTIKESVVLTFELLGGVRAYTEWARKNPDKFYDHYIKLLPSEIKAELSVTQDFAGVLERARMRVGSGRDIETITDGVSGAFLPKVVVEEAEYAESE